MSTMKNNNLVTKFIVTSTQIGYQSTKEIITACTEREAIELAKDEVFDSIIVSYEGSYSTLEQAKRIFSKDFKSLGEVKEYVFNLSESDLETEWQFSAESV